MRILNDDENYAIKRLNDFALSINASYLLFDKAPELKLSEAKELEKQINIVLDLIDRLTNIINKINIYTHQEIVHYTEDIRDYIDDNKIKNLRYIQELKELREQWKDIEKIIQNKPNKQLYMNWWKYGLYEKKTSNLLVFSIL